MAVEHDYTFSLSMRPATATMSGLESEFRRAHLQLNCSSNCPLLIQTLVSYDIHLKQTVRSIIDCTPIGNQIHNSFPLDFEEDDFLSDQYSRKAKVAKDSIAILGPASFVPNWLAKRPRLLIKKRSEGYEGRQILLDLMHEFKEIVMQNNYSKFDPNLELVLLCAVVVQDVETLTTVLSTRGHMLPMCLKAALLGRAMFYDRSDIFVDGVAELLKFGAPPGDCCHLRLKFPCEYPGFEEKLLLCVKLLLQHGADLRTTTMVNASWQNFCAIVVRDPEVALSLIEKAPLSGLRKNGDEFGRQAVISPLRLILYRVAHDLRNDHLDPAMTLLLHGVLPLLRAGAVCQPSFLDFGMTDMHALGQLSRLGAPGLLLAAEIRQQSSLDVANFNKLSRFFTETSAFLIRNYFDAANVSSFPMLFPRSLQATCRFAILRCLPLGLKERTAAIEKLGLPNSLGEYINFKDIDVLLRSVTCEVV